MSIRSFKRAQARRFDSERRRAARLKRRGGMVAGLALSASTLMVANAQAATYTVTSHNDDNGATVPCTAGSSSGMFNCGTLRDAVTTANADSSPDTINFATTVTSPITLTAPITITAPGLTITGPGASLLSISGGGTTQIFDITGPSSTVTDRISGLTLTDGNNPTGEGGAIAVTSDHVGLQLASDAITLNKTTGTSEDGGGLYVEGSLDITNSVISGNTASEAGGGIDLDSTDPFTHVSISHSTISGNTGDEDGGGIASYSSTVSLADDVISGNHGTGTDSSGGGLDIEAKYGAKITGSTISGNSASGDGGGVAIFDLESKYQPLLFSQDTISHNQAPAGAGISVDANGGRIDVSQSTISGNAGGAGSFGGGLMIAKYNGGKVELSDSTLAGNSAGSGGGVSLGGTIDGRHNAPVNQGYFGDQGSIAFNNSTIAGNTATSHGAGVYLGEYQSSPSAAKKSGSASLTSTVVADNKTGSVGDDLSRAAGSTSGGFVGAFSLVQNPGSAPLSKDEVITGKDPQLGALAGNGGPTQTMRPAGTSPLIDQGLNVDQIAADQRGDARDVDTGIANPPGGDGTDIGAVELAANQVVIPNTTTGFSASVKGKLLGSGRPLIGNRTPVTCSVKTGSLSSCSITVTSGGNKVASGKATASGTKKTLTVNVNPTSAGKTQLKKHKLGINGTATATSGSFKAKGNVHLLDSPITFSISGRSKKLGNGLLSELRQLGKLIASGKSTTCTAYTNKGKHDGALTKAQAKGACAAVKKGGFKGTTHAKGAGHSKPVGSTKTAKGRKANRRLVITFKF